MATATATAVMPAVEQREKLLPPWIVNWLAGVASGFGTAVVGHPFDTVKVRLQSQPQDKPVYSGVSDCLRQTIRKEGVGGFYRGVGSPMAGQVVLRAWQFVSYTKVKQAVCGTEDVNKMATSQFFICGTLTGLAIAPVESSIDLFKSQMQVQIIKETTTPGYKNPYRNVFHCVYEISRQRGVRGWGQGLPATFARNGCSAGLYFGSYESARRWLAKDGQQVNDIGTARTLLAGSLGGLGYWSLTYPLDVIKSAMQADATNPADRRYKSWFDCFTQLSKEGGLARFYKGYTPCIARSCPANATLFTCYQVSANFLNSL